MASIVQDPNPTSDPSYLGLSQGTDRMKANTATGDLLTGIANVGGGVIKAVYNAQTDYIERGLQDKIAQVQKDAGVDGAADLAASGQSPTGVLGEANIFGDTSNIKAGKGNPAGVARVGQTISGLDEAYQQGKLSESYYNARLLSIVKEAKAQYPGFKDEIDGIVQKTTGINPANALVRSLRADMDAAERARTAGASKDETYLNGHLQFMLPSTRAKIIAGDRSPEVVAKAKWEASGSQSRQFTIEQANRELELEVKTGQYDEGKTVKVAQQTVTEYVNNSFAHSTDTAGGAEGILKKIQEHGDKPWTPEEQAQIKAQFGNLNTQLSLGVDTLLTQPQYAQLPEDKKKAIREGALSRVATLRDALLNKDTGALTRDANFAEAIQNADVRRVLESNEWYRKVAAVQKIAGPAGADIVKGTFMTDQGMGARVKAIDDLNKMDLTLGEGSLNSQTKRMKEGSNAVPEWKDPKLYQAHIDGAVQGLVQSKDVTVAENHAKVMFGTDNVGFLDNYSPNSQQRVFRALTSPAVDLKMVELGKSNPELYKNYRDWVVSYGFQGQSKRLIDEVNQVHTSASSMANITWDEKSGLFRAELKPEYAGKKGFFGTSGTSGDPLAGLQKVVGELNQNIMIIKPILKREGGDPVQEIGKVLQANGWDPNAPKAPGFVQSLGSAIAGAYGKLTGESKPAPANLDASPLEYRLDKAPKSPGRTDNNSTNDSGISLDSGTLQDISSKSSGIKQVILKAESDGNYNDVYGTSRKIPLTSMTLDEVMALQGRMKKAGAASTAVGGFQFLNSTLTDLKKNLKLTGDETFDESLQNQLADALLQRRGFGEYLKGNIGHKELVNNLAKEWAGLPTTSGKSFYEGDGLNHSNVKLRSVLDELKTLRVSANEGETVELMPRSRVNRNPDDSKSQMSESTVHEEARRQLSRTQPVSILEDIIGGLSASKGQDNALRDAIRQRAVEILKQTGGYPGDPVDYNHKREPARSKVTEDIIPPTPEVVEAQNRYREKPSIETADALSKAIDNAVKKHKKQKRD